MKLVDTSTPSDLARRFRDIRAASLALAKPLSEADAQVQSMPEASPTKWHLAHTTWFFETLILEAAEVGFRPHHPAFRVLFNSYYNGIGEQHARPQRGLITRPGLAEVLAYRRARGRAGAGTVGARAGPSCLAMLTLGLHHEQQHQELILCDLLHLLSCNPLQPAYLPGVAFGAFHSRAAGLGGVRRRTGGHRPPGRRASPSTTSSPGIASGWRRTRWPTGW